MLLFEIALIDHVYFCCEICHSCQIYIGRIFSPVDFGFLRPNKFLQIIGLSLLSYGDFIFASVIVFPRDHFFLHDLFLPRDPFST